MEKKLSFKDKLKLFQLEANKMSILEKNKPNKHLVKIKDFGKHKLISGEIEDETTEETIHSLKETKNPRKKTICGEILHFIQERPVFHVY